MLVARIKKFEKGIIAVLMVAMAVVLLLATIDLLWLIIRDINLPPSILISMDDLLDIFGLFMLVLIGIELLGTIYKTYVSSDRDGHMRVVVAVALIAICRKVIILDVKQLDSGRILGIAAIILALAAAYHLTRSTRRGFVPDHPAAPPPLAGETDTSEK